MIHRESPRKLEALAWIGVGLIWAISAASFYGLWNKLGH